MQKKPILGALYIVLAITMGGLIWRGLPTRWLPVDLGATVLGTLMASVGVGLIRASSWATKLARLCASLMLATGLTIVSVLVCTTSYLWGIYGPVGQGGALIVFVAALLIFPYFVAFPLWQLYSLKPAQ